MSTTLRSFENKIIYQNLNRFWGLNLPQFFIYKYNKFKTLSFLIENPIRHLGLLGILMSNLKIGFLNKYFCGLFKTNTMPLKIFEQIIIAQIF